MNIKEVPKLNVLHPEALISLSQEYNKVYEENAEKMRTLEQYRDDYKVLKNRLKTLPDKISYGALIPLGTKALAPGKIVHTNEILCLLGDNYFMECSAKSATEMVDRRLNKCEQLLLQQKQEGERLENWKSSVTKLIMEVNDNETMEIMEEVDDREYEKLKADHRESVRRHKESLAKERREKTAKEAKEQEEFWAKLEERELEEDLLRAEEEHNKRMHQQQQQKQKVVKSKVEEKIPPVEPKKVSSSKQVKFCDIPEIKEIEENEPPLSPSIEERLSKHVEGLSVSVVEKHVDNLGKPASNVPTDLSQSTPSANESMNPAPQPAKEVEPPKKVSLFKQKRMQ